MKIKKGFLVFVFWFLFYDFMVMVCGFMVYGFMVLWFYGFVVLWLYGFVVLWLYGFLVSKIYKTKHFMFLIDIGPISMIPKICLDGSSSFVGACLFQN